MRGQAGFLDVDERLKELSAKGDALERLNAVVDFELFRADLVRAVPRSDRVKGGRPPFDHVLMFKVLILQSNHTLSDERTEYLIRDRLSFMRFLGLGLADTVPDANTIWTFREALTRARIAGRPAIEVLFERFNAALAAAVSRPTHCVHASAVGTPTPRGRRRLAQFLRPWTFRAYPWHPRRSRLHGAHADSVPGHSAGARRARFVRYRTNRHRQDRRLRAINPPAPCRRSTTSAAANLPRPRAEPD